MFDPFAAMESLSFLWSALTGNSCCQINTVAAWSGVLVIALTIYKCSQRTCGRSRFPQAKGLPIVGNVADFTPKTILKTLVDYPRIYGPVVRFSVFNRFSHLITDAELIREVLQKRPKKFRRRRSEQYLSDLLNISTGLFNSNGEVWSRIRRVTSSSFSTLNVKLKFPAIVEQVEGLVDRLKQHAAKGDRVDMKFEAFSFTIRVITVVAFGLSLDNEITHYFISPQFMEDIVAQFRLVAEYRLFPAPHAFWRWSPSYKYEVEGLKANDRVTAASRRVIDAKRHLLAQPGATPSAMIDFMLLKEDSQAADSLTDEEVIANVKTFFMAGAETTSVVISWMVYVMAVHLDVRDKIRAEADALLLKVAQEGRSITVDDIAELKYCPAVERELLRVYSPALASPFELTDFSESLFLANGLEVVPGEEIWINVEGIMRDPLVYPDPLAFKPERWLTDDRDQLAKMEAYYFTFGGGPRICPGKHLASAEILAAMVYVSHHFDVSLDCPKDEIKRIMNFAASANKMPVKFTLRKF